jgi:hypothetical protein
MAKSYYIKTADQATMIQLAGKYNELSENGTIPEGEEDEYGNIHYTRDEKNLLRRINLVMDEYYTYADKIILGIIQSPMYKFWQWEEMDDLISVGRMHILKCIQKEQYKPEKGKYFDFISTVVSNNLRSHTLKKNRNRKFKSGQSLDDVYMNKDMTYNHDVETNMVVAEVFKELKQHFEGRGRFVELTEILEDYYYQNIGKKFVKKHFIEVAMGFCFSPSLINTYFNHIRRLPKVKEILHGKDSL